MTERIQRKRTKGWRMPENTIYVGRNSIFGNPFRVTDWRSPEGAALAYRKWLDGDLTLAGWLECARVSAKLTWPKHTKRERREMRNRVLREIPRLRGKNLACWCPLNQPCHADVLLEIANR